MITLYLKEVHKNADQVHHTVAVNKKQSFTTSVAYVRTCTAVHIWATYYD